jgi:exosortase
LRHGIALFASLAVVTLAAWRPLADTFVLSWRNNEYTQILLILPVAAALIYLKWDSLLAALAFGLRSGLALLALALLVAVWAFAGALPSDQQLSLYMTALVLSWIGIFFLCLGPRAARSVMFPLLFLFGMVPLPRIVLGPIIEWLQITSTYASHWLFALLGVPCVQDRFLLTIPGLTIDVAPECSSIRSSSMLFVTTLVLVYLLLRSPWRRLIVVALSIPLSVAKNGLRIAVLGILGTRVNRGYLTGRLHHQGGILYLLIALVCIFAAIWWLRRGENPALAPQRRIGQESRTTAAPR